MWNEALMSFFKIESKIPRAKLFSAGKACKLGKVKLDRKFLPLRLRIVSRDEFELLGTERN